MDLKNRCTIAKTADKDAADLNITADCNTHLLNKLNRSSTATRIL